MIGSLSLEDLARIRRMSETDARAFVADKNLSVEQLTTVLLLAGKNINEAHKPLTVNRGIVFDNSRRKWFLAAWLAGASWRQLAWLHGVAPQTVLSSADRLMPSHLRQTARLATTMTPEALSAHRAAFIAEPALADLDPVALAQHLLATTDKDTDI